MCSVLVPPSCSLVLLSARLRQASSFSCRSVAGGGDSERYWRISHSTKRNWFSCTESVGADMEAVGKMKILQTDLDFKTCSTWGFPRK